jgi:hypothetical protein
LPEITSSVVVVADWAIDPIGIILINQGASSVCGFNPHRSHATPFYMKHNGISFNQDKTTPMPFTLPTLNCYIVGQITIKSL